jgi:hypothetical protein
VSLCSEIQFHGREYCEPDTLFRRTENGLFISGLDVEHIYFFHISIILLYRVLIHVQIFGCLFLYVRIMTCDFLGVPTMLFRNFINLLYWSFTA